MIFFSCINSLIIIKQAQSFYTIQLPILVFLKNGERKKSYEMNEIFSVTVFKKGTVIFSSVIHTYKQLVHELQVTSGLQPTNWGHIILFLILKKMFLAKGKHGKIHFHCQVINIHVIRYVVR